MKEQKEKREYSASDYQAIAQEHKEALETNKRIFLRSGVFVILTALVIIIAVLGWFVMNNRTEAVTSLISSISSRYYLTSGKEGDDVGVWDKKDNLDFDLSDSMKVDKVNNLNNVNEASKLSPGSFGALKFTIVPNAKDLGNIKVSVEINLKYRTNNLNPEDETRIKEVVSGHLLFFTERDDSYYEGWTWNKEAKEYSFTVPKKDFLDANNETTVSKECTLYWIWPQQFHNYIYTGGRPYYKNLFTDKNGDYTNLINDMKHDIQKKKYFYDSNIKIIDNFGSGMSDSDYRFYTEEFNKADQLIGANVDYIQIRLNTTEIGG